MGLCGSVWVCVGLGLDVWVWGALCGSGGVCVGLGLDVWVW